MSQRIVAVAALVLASFVFVPAPVEAAPFDIDLAISAPDNWKSVVLSTPMSGTSQCLKFKLYANYSAGKEAFVIPIWFATGGGSFATYMLWSQPTSFRATVTTSTPAAFSYTLGSQPMWGLGAQIHYPSPSGEETICGSIKKIAFAAPGATNAKLRIDLPAGHPTAGTINSGPDAVLHTAQDFTGGARVEYEAGIPVGASVVRDQTVTSTFGPGMLAAFFAGGQTQLAVNGPAPFGNQGGTCTGYAPIGLVSCHPSLGWLGFGNAAVAPAGTYTFRVTQSVSPIEALHVAAVAAPVNWG